MHRMLLIVLLTATAAFAEDGELFSALDSAVQNELRQLVEPPPPAERTGPYSTPMYYLMHEGYEYDGAMDHKPDKRHYKKTRGSWGVDYGQWSLDRNRPDWQETMIRNWAQLGLNSTHLNIYPVDGKLTMDPAYRAALEDFVRLSEKHGLRIGIRLDALGGYKAWEMHPNNPDNQIDEYLVYVRDVATLMKGQALYYVLGDELTLHQEDEEGLTEQHWTPQLYLDYFKQVAGVIREVDPQVRISMFAPSSGEWFNVLYLLEHGYAEVGDAVAINHYDYNTVPKFFEDAAKLAPDLMFLSNGVGYISAPTEPRYPSWDPYSKHKTEASHAEAVAKSMFAWWDLGADAAPYYISLRNWVKDGTVYPRWYGFFGFEDYIIDEHDRMTIKRYPAWYAFQTVAHTFYNRDDFTEPAFDVTIEGEPTMARVYEHALPSGAAEVLLMLWHDGGEAKQVNVTLNDPSLRHAVEPDLMNHHVWHDVAYERTDAGVSLALSVWRTPRIIRLFRR